MLRERRGQRLDVRAGQYAHLTLACVEVHDTVQFIRTNGPAEGEGQVGGRVPATDGADRHRMPASQFDDCHDMLDTCWREYVARDLRKRAVVGRRVIGGKGARPVGEVGGRRRAVHTHGLDDSLEHGIRRGLGKLGRGAVEALGHAAQRMLSFVDSDLHGRKQPPLCGYGAWGKRSGDCWCTNVATRSTRSLQSVRRRRSACI